MPEIEIEKAIVNSGEGYDAELSCEVHADPRPKVCQIICCILAVFET